MRRPAAPGRSGGQDRSFGPFGVSRTPLQTAGMDGRSRVQRLLACAGGTLLSAALASGCGGTAAAPAAQPAATVRYTSDRLGFRRPAAWKPYPFRWRGELHVQPLLYLSTQPVGDPCRTSGQTTVCGWPLRRLRPGGVLVVWEERGWPGWSLSQQAGAPIRVGGRSAKRLVGHPGACGTVGADLTVEVAVASPLPSTWTQITACLRRPGLAANLRRLDALLASTRFAAS